MCIRKTADAENNLTVLVPVRFTLDEGKYRAGIFPGKPLHSGAGAGKPCGYQTSGTGRRQDLCWLKASGKVPAAWVQWLKLLAYGVFLGLLMAVAFQFAVQWAKSGKALAGAALLLAIVTGLIDLTVKPALRPRSLTNCCFLPAFRNALPDRKFFGRLAAAPGAAVVAHGVFSSRIPNRRTESFPGAGASGAGLGVLPAYYVGAC